MKRFIKILSLVTFLFILTGCKSDSMDDITIYTSVYPIEFVTDKLYGEYADIYNMYPQGINPYEYNFTDKQITNYADSDLIVYNGLDKEKDLIVKMLNKNKNLKIIDATNKITYKNNLDEIWINPSNLLMIANNIKDGLKEYVSSRYIIDTINNNYEELKLEISSLDAELKEIAANADYKDILVSSNQFNFLEKYGLNVISFDEETYTESIYNTALNLYNEDKISYIFLKKDEKENEMIKNLRKECSELKILYIDTLNNIATTDKNEEINYITIMNENIEKFKQELY